MRVFSRWCAAFLALGVGMGLVDRASKKEGKNLCRIPYSTDLRLTNTWAMRARMAVCRSLDGVRVERLMPIVTCHNKSSMWTSFGVQCRNLRIRVLYAGA